MTPTERAALLREADALVERGTGREWPVLRDLAAEVRALEAALDDAALALKHMGNGAPLTYGRLASETAYAALSARPAPAVAPAHSIECRAVYEAAMKGRPHPGDDYTCPACPWPQPARVDADRTATGATGRCPTCGTGAAK